MPEAPSLRDRNRERTRQEIAAAALILFTERGFAATTVEQIAAAAGVAPRTFFRYFPTKEDVVFGDQAESVARLRAALAETFPGEPVLGRIRRAVLAVQAPGHNSEREIVRARLVAEAPTVRARADQLVESFEDVVAEVLAEQMGGDEIAQARARIVAAAAFGALRGARRAASTLPDPNPRWLVETAFDILELGAARLLLPDEGERGPP